MAAAASDLLTSQPWQWGLCQPIQAHVYPPSLCWSQPNLQLLSGEAGEDNPATQGAGCSQVLHPRALQVPAEAGPGRGMLGRGL